MKSEIKNIKIVHKYGAFGNQNSFGRWVYGRRPDGRTVACKNEITKEGGIKIWSYWVSPNCNANEIDTCETEFTKDEWESIMKQPNQLRSIKCNQILRNRTPDN